MKLLQVTALFATITVALCVDEEVVIRGKALITPNTKQIPSYQVTGTVEISQKARGGPSFFTLKLEGFPPKTTHGFHVHATGDIHTNGCKSTGGHYNPLTTTHGGPNDEIRHVGDLGNIVADEEGNVSIVIVDRMAGLVGDHSIAGRAFVVHAGVDDLGRGVGAKRAGSLKTGNAGARVACGIIYHV